MNPKPLLASVLSVAALVPSVARAQGAAAVRLDLVVLDKATFSVVP